MNCHVSPPLRKNALDCKKNTLNRGCGSGKPRWTEIEENSQKDMTHEVIDHLL
jgi:hypothetical protein